MSDKRYTYFSVPGINLQRIGTTRELSEGEILSLEMTAILLPGCRGGLVHDDNVIAKNLRTEDPKHCGHQSENRMFSL